MGKLARCASVCIKAEIGRLLGRQDVVPGMIAAIQTFGSLGHWQPHFHFLSTCGAFTREGDFLELPELDMDRLLVAWQEAVFALYLREGKIEPEVVDDMRSWPHSGFSVDQSVFLPAGDSHGIERLVRYMTRCPFSLSRLVKVTETGQVVYKAEKSSCQAFPDPQKDMLEAGVQRDFQVFEPLDFLAEFTQHIPAKGSHLIRYYGVYQQDVIEKILRYCGLWRGNHATRAPPETEDFDSTSSDNRTESPDEADQVHELTFVPQEACGPDF